MVVTVPRRVLLDANILYSRIIRDYFLYAAIDGIISVFWSEAIINESLENMIRKVPSFTIEHAEVLKQRLNANFPDASVEISDCHHLMARGINLPDPNDVHVLAAAMSCGASILCTNNLRDFPVDVLSTLELTPMSADELLLILIKEHPDAVLRVHDAIVNRKHSSTHEETLYALKRAGSTRSATRLEGLLSDKS